MKRYQVKVSVLYEFEAADEEAAAQLGREALESDIRRENGLGAPLLPPEVWEVDDDGNLTEC